MPKCGRECEVFSRVVGYYRPVNNWNKGKQAEFAERLAFSAAMAAQRLRENPPTRNT